MHTHMRPFRSLQSSLQEAQTLQRQTEVALATAKGQHAVAEGQLRSMNRTLALAQEATGVGYGWAIFSWSNARACMCSCLPSVLNTHHSASYTSTSVLLCLLCDAWIGALFCFCCSC